MKTSPCTDTPSARPAHVALFPGTFDPFTIGHESIVRRALALFDEVVVGIGVNASKHTHYSLEERLQAIRHTFATEGRVRVIAYEGLTVEAARRCGACCMVRGVRTVQDFEYEMQIALTNHELDEGIETVLLYTEPQLAHISSSLVRTLLEQGRDVSGYLPAHRS